ncbi:MAG: PEP/pyruvate-binding domain-containing protein [Anaerolineae bacterium]
MNYIRWFQEVGAGNVDLVGGKGANLGEMAAAGLPVPPGFCLTAAAYRDFIQATGLDATIRSILAETRQDEPANVEAKTARIRDLITAQDVPAAMVQQILDAYHRLGEELGTSDAEAVPVAVRSSATAEDLPTASFAGQQDTYLNVRGTEDLLDHVRRCWASLWTARAVTYRSRQGFDHHQVHLAVVVQAMIEAQVSGIMFTANPITGNRDEAVINASWGLGEAIVSGLVTPDTFTVRKSDGRILSWELGAKECIIEYAKDGGAVERETPARRREMPALSDEQIAELVAFGQQIETHYGTPQDIEWAYANGRFYALQARPITTLVQPAAPPAGEAEYNRTMFVEIFPDPLSPLFLSVIRPLFQGMLDFTFEALGFRPPRDMEAVGVFYNQPYFNRNYIAATLRPLSPSVREGLVSEIVNPFGRHQQRVRAELSPGYLRMVVRLLRFMVSFPHRLPGLVAHYRAEVAKVAALPVERMPDEELVARLRDLVFGAASRLLNYDFLMIALIGRTYQMLGTLLERHFGDETEELRSKLISGVTGNVTMEANKALWDLAQVARNSPAVAALLREYDDREVQAQLEKTPQGRAFLDQMEQFLNDYGHRETRMDILYPTWGEDPAPVLSFVRGYLDADETQSPHQQQTRLARQRRELLHTVRTRLEQSLPGRYVLSPIFHWVLKHSQIHTRERDTMHFELTRLFPPFRRLLLELGRRWRERGLITQPDDVFFLTLDELQAVARSPRPMRQEVQERRAEYEAHKRRPWPNIIRGRQEIYDEREVSAEAPDGELRGIAGSPGVVTGAARVVRGPEEFDRLQNGEILVAPLTNPAWTPLFAIAGGIVTEVGGILSHGAIVAREYGIPAVMGVAGATTLVDDGQPMTVDGDKGVVYLQ